MEIAPISTSGSISSADAGLRALIRQGLKASGKVKDSENEEDEDDEEAVEDDDEVKPSLSITPRRSESPRAGLVSLEEAFDGVDEIACNLEDHSISPEQQQPKPQRRRPRRRSSVLVDAVHDPYVHASSRPSPGQLYKTESGRLWHAGRICIALVGLPARGKTHLAVSLTRYLRWLGVKTHAFHLGDYRRALYKSNENVPEDYFLEHSSPEVERQKLHVRNACIYDVLAFFESEKGQVAIYDAVNPTPHVRRELAKRFEERDIQTLFLESVATDPAIIERNVREVKISSPDYQGWDEKQAVHDYISRIAKRLKDFHTVDESELSFIKTFNFGERLEANRANLGYLPNRIVFFLMNLHKKSGSVYFACAGAEERKEKGPSHVDPGLSEKGREYADKLLETLTNYRKYIADQDSDPVMKSLPLVVWTSTRQKTVQTAQVFANAGFLTRQRPQLTQRNPGVCAGLTQEEIKAKYPQEYQLHQQDPYHHRYPRAESFHDLAVRLEPVILELERMEGDLLVIGHETVLSVLYGYLMACSIVDIPSISFPNNQIVRIAPRAYNNELFHIPVGWKPPIKKSRT